MGLGNRNLGQSQFCKFACRPIQVQIFESLDSDCYMPTGSTGSFSSEQLVKDLLVFVFIILFVKNQTEFNFSGLLSSAFYEYILRIYCGSFCG